MPDQVRGDAATQWLQVRQHIAPEGDEVGLPCSKMIGSPLPTCTYAISWSRIRRR
jgi:hypothetical protein